MLLALLGRSRPPTGLGPDPYGTWRYRHHLIGDMSRAVGFDKM
jgi:hypothetical protein